jgi:hypothetical protein
VDGAPKFGTNAAPRAAGARARGVTHHARTGRYESHIWVEGRQVYLGGFYTEQQAAVAYDLAAVRFRREEAITNLGLEAYAAELANPGDISKEDAVQCLRSQSKAMSRLAAGPGSPARAWELMLSGEMGGGDRPASNSSVYIYII